MSDLHEGLDRGLVEHLGAAAIAVDPAGGVVSWNDQAAILFGVSRDEALGEDVRRVLRDERLREVVDALLSGGALDAEVALQDPLGVEMLCFVRVTPIEEQRRRVGAVALAVDISHRRRFEQRLQAQYAAARVLAEASDIDEATGRFLREIGEAIGWDAGDVWVFDEEAGVFRFVDLWVGPRLKAEPLLEAGRTVTFRWGDGLPGRVLSEGAPSWIPDIREDGNFPRARHAAQAGVRAAFSFPIRRGDRILGVMEFFHRLPLETEPSLLEAMDAVGRQFGQFLERATVIEAMRHSDALKTSILEASLDPVIALDHRGAVMEWNSAAERAFGYSREEVIGREMAELIVPDDLRERHRAGFRRHIETGESRILGRPVELIGQRRDGSRFPVELTISRVDLPGPPTFTGFVRDITERKQAEATMVEAERRLRHALEAGKMGAWEWDIVSGRVEWSAGLERIHGIEEGSFAGTLEAFEADIHPGERERVRRAIERALAGLEPYRIEYRIVRPDRSQRWLEAIGDVQRDASGEPIRMHGVCMDVTERREADEVRARLYEGEQVARAQAEDARARLAFLAEASRILTSSLSYERTLAKVAELAVPRVADWCSVDMVDESGASQQVAVGHNDDEGRALLRTLRERFPPGLEGPGGLGEVLRTGEALIYPSVHEEMLRRVARSQEHLRILEALSMRSAMIVPLKARGRTMGAMTFGSTGRRFERSDLALAQELADRAAIAIDNARLYEERSAIARSLQRSLLPPALPEIPGIEVAARYQPAGEGFQVGGDFYDVYQRSPGEWAIVIGDVCGKGPEAAAVTGLARHTLRAASIEERSPSGSLLILNEALLQDGTDRFCTVAKGRLIPDADGANLIVACAGHHLPCVIRSDGTVEAVGEPGTLLGLFEDVTISDRTVRLGAGDAVIFYTDGVIDDRDGARSGNPRTLADLLQGVPEGPAEAIAHHIEGQAQKASPQGLRDDVAIVVVRVRP